MKPVHWIFAAVLVAAGTAAAQPRAQANDPDAKEISEYRLNMGVIQRYAAFVKKAGDDPACRKCFDNNPPGKAPTLDAGEKIINACPAAVAGLKAAGIKPREFLILTAALIGDMTAVGMKKAGAIQKYPPSISPENAAFVETNYDKLKDLLAGLAKHDQ